MTDGRLGQGNVFLRAELVESGKFSAQPERILEQSGLGFAVFQRLVGEDGARVVRLRLVYQFVGHVRGLGSAAQVAAVPPLGHVLPRDGPGAVQYRGVEQIARLHGVFVNVDDQWVHLFLFLVLWYWQEQPIPQLLSKVY